MNINRIELFIVPNNFADTNTYGFDYEFDDGLNIITGDNSSGKSTILSCIYYCLGLEQLIGSTGSKTLSPALKDYFKYNKKDIKVKSSYCKLYITSKNGDSYTLKRWIKTEDRNDKVFNEIEIFSDFGHFSKYIHSPRDHEEHGFYRWLADINKLDVINVEKGVRGGDKPLYMQNIFALSFVEQTKGWADFFSMMPPFGIKDIKKKVVEYALGLSSLENSIKLDEIKLEKERLKEFWAREVNFISFQANSIQASISTVNKDTPVSKKNIDGIYAVSLCTDGA
jgi:predicted ATP-dependent endonuclease of OLD family